jgi:hypothetical protein
MNKQGNEEGALGDWFATNCAELGVECVPDYVVAGVRWPIYLPRFGGVNGMVVGSINCTYANPGPLYFSLVNPTSYIGSTHEVLRETLNDWGWFSSAEERPPWYSGAEWGGSPVGLVQGTPYGPAD